MKQKPPDFLAALAGCAAAAPNTVLPKPLLIELAIAGGVSEAGGALLATPLNSMFVDSRSFESTAGVADPNVNGGAAPAGAAAAPPPKGDAFVAPNLNFDAPPSSAFGPLNMKPPPVGCGAEAAGAGAALPPKLKTDGCAADAKLSGAALLCSDISADLRGDGAAADALALGPNVNGDAAGENVEAAAPPTPIADGGGVSDDFMEVAPAPPSTLLVAFIALLPNSSGVELAEVVVAAAPKLFVWLPNNLTDEPLFSPNAGESADLGVAAAAAAKDRCVSLVSFEAAGVNAEVAKLVTNALFELLTTLAPPFVTTVSFFAAKPLVGSLFSTDENKAVFFLGASVDELISLNRA